MDLTMDKSDANVRNGNHNIDGDTGNDFGLSAEQLLYRTKFEIMSKRCKQIEADNLRIINLIYHTKKLTKKFLKEKRLLIDRLYQKKDGFRTITRPTYIEVRKEPKPVPMNPSPSPPILSKLLSSAPDIPTPSQIKRADSTPSLPTTGKSKSAKTRSDKGQKKPINPYLMFCKENRAKVQGEYFKTKGREINNTELTKELAHRWQTIKPELKLDYQSRYEIEKAKYNVVKLLRSTSQPEPLTTVQSELKKSPTLVVKLEKETT